MQLRRLHSISPGMWYKADTLELNMGPQASRVHMLLPRVPFTTLQNHVGRVSLPAMPQAHSDPGAPNTFSPQMNLQRGRSPRRPCPSHGESMDTPAKEPVLVCRMHGATGCQ